MAHFSPGLNQDKCYSFNQLILKSILKRFWVLSVGFWVEWVMALGVRHRVLGALGSLRDGAIKIIL